VGKDKNASLSEQETSSSEIRGEGEMKLDKERMEGVG